MKKINRFRIRKRHRWLLSGVAGYKGSTAGTVTDTEGKFALNADKDDALQFKMAGYELFEHKVEKAENNLVIALQPEEVLVVGSGKWKILKIKTMNWGQIVVRGTDALKGTVIFCRWEGGRVAK